MMSIFKLRPKLLVGLVLCVFALLLAWASAQTGSPDQTKSTAPPVFTIVDLGTLGGATAAAGGMSSGQGHAVTDMIVGSSTAADNTAHAFLFTNGQMFDLNELCDLSTSDFAVLTAATSIDNAGRITGEGVTINQQNHAFLLTPALVDGGQWSNDCCQWVWKQVDTATASAGFVGVETGWWWESDCHCYKWHGPPGKHSDCPPKPPHCWNWPLPCPPETGCAPYPRPCWCCFHEDFTGRAIVAQIDQAECQKHHGQCFPTQAQANQYCSSQTSTPTPTPTPIITPTPTPTPSIHWWSCWCCENGVVKRVLRAFCHGQCYSSEEDAKKNCLAPLGPSPQIDMCWCCLDSVNGGNVANISKTECQQKGGVCYSSEAEAVAHCKVVPFAYCCVDGVVRGPEPRSTCISGGGQAFDTSEDAQKYCGQTNVPTFPGDKCWCCLYPDQGGTAVYVTSSYCKQAGGTCYATQEEANARCKVVPFAYCCIDGVVSGPMPRSQCPGEAYDTAEDAQKYCAALHPENKSITPHTQIGPPPRVDQHPANPRPRFTPLNNSGPIVRETPVPQGTPHRTPISSRPPRTRHSPSPTPFVPKGFPRGEVTPAPVGTPSHHRPPLKRRTSSPSPTAPIIR